MYSVTQAFHDAFSAVGRDRIYIKAVFNGETELDSDELQELVITEQFGASDGVTIGAAFSSSCKLTMYVQDGLALKNSYFTPYVGTEINNEIVYVPKGRFYVPSDGIEQSGKLWVTVTGYDRMASLEDDYIANISFPATPTQILADVCSQANVAVPTITLPDVQIENAYAGTYREQLGWLAGLTGCNAKFDANGNLVFVWYTDSGLTVTHTMQNLNGLERTGEKFSIESLITGTESNVITVGTGASVSFVNPYIDETIAKNVLALVKGKPMQPCSCQWRGDPSIEAGDIVTVINEDGITELPVFVMEQTTNIKGGMSCTTLCYGVEDAEYNVKSNVTQQLKRLYNSVTESFRNATEKIVGAKGGYYEITYDEDGFPTGWTLRDTPAITDTTKMWIMSAGGLGYSDDGGKSISKVAVTMDGYVSASAVAIGSVSEDGSLEWTALENVLSSKITKTDAENITTSKIEQSESTIRGEISQAKQESIQESAENIYESLSSYRKWFVFDSDGLTIGEDGTGNDSNIKLRLDNDRISFLFLGAEVAYISNNKLYIADGEFLNSLVLGDFGFIPRANGNLTFKKVK